MKWFKLWSEEAKNDSDDEQLYLRLVKDPNDGDLWLCATKRDGEVKDENRIILLSESNRAIMIMTQHFQETPLRTDLKHTPLFTTEWEHKRDHPKYSMVEMPSQIREAIVRKVQEGLKQQAEQETKH